MRAIRNLSAAWPMRKLETTFLLAVFCTFAWCLPMAAQAGPSNGPASSEQSSSGASAQETGPRQKLILKDGSVQIVSQYQVIGKRVRYYSIQRSDWEEIPASLVDWPATRKAAAQTKQREQQAVTLARRVDLEEHPGSLDVSGGIAGTGLPAGVLLPSGDGMYVFNGHSILAVKADLATSKLDKGRFIAKMISPVPVISTRYTISLKGKRAKTEIANSEPVFFFRTDRGVTPQFLLIRAEEKGNRREFAYLNEYMGQKKTEAKEIPIKLRAVDPDTYRLTAIQDLSPGQYVLAEPTPGQSIDLYVWDFGIAASAKKH